MPASLVVDSLILENESLKAIQRWDDAADRLEEAVRIAREVNDDDLTRSDAYNPRPGCHMDRLEVSSAIEDFKAAEAACKELVEGGRFVFKIRLYHIRHGLALADRLTGSSRRRRTSSTNRSSRNCGS